MAVKAVGKLGGRSRATRLLRAIGGNRTLGSCPKVAGVASSAPAGDDAGEVARLRDQLDRLQDQHDRLKDHRVEIVIVSTQRYLLNRMLIKQLQEAGIRPASTPPREDAIEFLAEQERKAKAG